MTGKKLLDITDVKGATANIADLKVFGNGDTFQLICKASSAEQGWMKSTKAMQIDGLGCIVQVSTQQGANVAEALVFVPGAKIELIDGDVANGRRLVSIASELKPYVAVIECEAKPMTLGDQMSFSHALAYLKQGARIARDRWIDGFYLELDSADIPAEIIVIGYQRVKPAWIPRQEDITADDWRVV